MKKTKKTRSRKKTQRKIRVLTIGDHPLLPSGVGTQSKYMCEALLASGKFEVVSLGGAVSHQSYNVMKTEEYGDDWELIPVDGYGTKEIVRSVIRSKRPDILWFMTDPRFYKWLWEIEDEIRPLMPMVYYHVWDNFPAPTFNKLMYDSTDVIASISKVTRDIVEEVAGQHVEKIYVPHSVNTEIFKKRPVAEVNEFKEKQVDLIDFNKKVFFWNNRNARRKQSGSLIFWFKDFLDIVGHDKATLIMHTDPKDAHGQDLSAIIHSLGLDEGQVIMSTAKYPPEILSMLYNVSDCTVNISDAEGFGLATLESLACETPIMVNMTGGLQEQVRDEEGNEFGAAIEPTSRAIIGSQEVPWIYEDRLSKESVVEAFLKMYHLSDEETAALGKEGREHVMKNYNFEDFGNCWVSLMEKTHKTYGSWPNKKYKRWSIQKIE